MGKVRMNRLPKLTAVAFIVAPLALGGCGWTEDLTDGWFDDDSDTAATGDRDRPSAAEAPEGLRSASLPEGLAGDTGNRRYADLSPARQDAESEPRPRALAPTSAPSALPATPVGVAPVGAAPVGAAPVGATPVNATPTRAVDAPAAAPVPDMPWLGPRPQPLEVVTSEEQAGARLPNRPDGAVFAAGIYDPSVGGTVVVDGQGVRRGGGYAGDDRTGTLTSADLAMSVLPPGAEKVATIQFADGSSRLSGADREILRQVVALQRQRGSQVRVVGHASSRTANMTQSRHRMVNLDISSARANAVVRELVRLGADSGKVSQAAVADRSPAYFEVMPSGEAGNRRAEIYFVN